MADLIPIALPDGTIQQMTDEQYAQHIAGAGSLPNVLTLTGRATQPADVIARAKATAGSRAASSGDNIEQYIRQAAVARGIDPDYAVRVANTEGGVKQFKLGDGGKSGGAFQLYTGGGLGNNFQRDTGLDPLDPANHHATIDYALDYAAAHGGQFDPNVWHGARQLSGPTSFNALNTTVTSPNALGSRLTALGQSMQGAPQTNALVPAKPVGVPLESDPGEETAAVGPKLGSSLALMQLLALGTHKITPVTTDYDPFKVMPKLGAA